MEQDAIYEAAKFLLKARKERVQVDHIPSAFRPGNREDAYAVQRRLFDLLGTGSEGWFLGGTNGSEIIPIPYVAPILKGALLDSPAKLGRDVFIDWEVDVEFGFTFKTEIGPQKVPYTREEVLAAVETIHPTLDVVNKHFKDLETVGWPSVIADIGTDGAIVRGEGSTNWNPDNLGNHEVVLLVNGTQVRSGRGNRIMGNPVNALVWFVRHMSEQCRTIKAGEFVSSGSCTDIYKGKVNDRVRADFGAYGFVEAVLAG